MQRTTDKKSLPGRSRWMASACEDRTLVDAVWGRCIGLAIRRCIADGKETVDHRYYINSLSRHGRRFASCVRDHWSIENSLHWVLDMTFREDESRVRERCLADNLGWLRRLALTLLKQHPGKDSIAMKRRMAGWSVDFLAQVLTRQTT